MASAFRYSSNPVDLAFGILNRRGFWANIVGDCFDDRLGEITCDGHGDMTHFGILPEHSVEPGSRCWPRHRGFRSEQTI